MLEHEVVEREGDHVLLRLRGELAGQLWTRPLRSVIERDLGDERVKVITFDLSPVEFLDYYGVATLVTLHKDSTDKGKRFVVEGAHGQVSDKLKVTGVESLLQGQT